MDNDGLRGCAVTGGLPAGGFLCYTGQQAWASFTFTFTCIHLAAALCQSNVQARQITPHKQVRDLSEAKLPVRDYSNLAGIQLTTGRSPGELPHPNETRGRE